MAVWIGTLAVASVLLISFVGLLPEARSGALAVAGLPFIATLAFLTYGVMGFFIKRHWGIALFAIGEVCALRWIVEPTTWNVLVALAMVAAMVSITLVYRKRFRAF